MTPAQTEFDRLLSADRKAELRLFWSEIFAMVCVAALALWSLGMFDLASQNAVAGISSKQTNHELTTKTRSLLRGAYQAEAAASSSFVRSSNRRATCGYC